MAKKGAIELGINTVVILVIALVIIAGGIAFITGVFDKVGEIGPINLPKIPATSSSPILIDGGDPELKMGSEDNLDVNVYNKLSVDSSITVVFGDCKTTANNPNCQNVAPILVALPQTIPSGESAGFRTFLKASCASDETVKLVPGEYICALKAVTAQEPAETIAETQVILKVTN